MDGSGINMNQVSQVLWLTLKNYTLWQTNTANWKITIFSRSINYFSGPCSIAMLNYQMVMIWTSAYIYYIWVPVRRVIRNKVFNVQNGAETINQFCFSPKKCACLVVHWHSKGEWVEVGHKVKWTPSTRTSHSVQGPKARLVHESMSPFHIDEISVVVLNVCWSNPDFLEVFQQVRWLFHCLTIYNTYIMPIYNHL
jgi:hypothetical protein